MQLTFVTTNAAKFNQAKHTLSLFNIDLGRDGVDFQELQSEDGEVIARHKAEQAFAALKKPIVISDDCWNIPGLKGFPGPYMKDMNHYLTPEDWLRLTLPLTDRRIILEQHVVYQDEHGQQHFISNIEATLLKEIRGAGQFAHLDITSFDGTHSRSEDLAAGYTAIKTDTKTSWHQLGEWLTKNHA